MNVAIFGRKVNKENAQYYSELLKIFKEFGWNPIFHDSLKEKLIKKIGISDTCDTFSSHKDFESGIDLSLSIDEQIEELIDMSRFDASNSRWKKSLTVKYVNLYHDMSVRTFHEVVKEVIPNIYQM